MLSVALFSILTVAFSQQCSIWDTYQHTCPGWIPKYNPSDYEATDGDKIVLSDANKNDGAACLDGSPPVMYWRAGSGDGVNKFHVFFEGGGACVGDATGLDEPCFDSCEHRAGTDLGSSKGYPTKSNYDNGYMSTSKTTNPLAYNWNTVYIKYCDGGAHGGDNSTTVKAGKYELHFRGRRNMKAVFAELIKTYKFGSATDVLVSGCSAGGVAVYEHALYILQNYVPKTANYLSMPDSGFFLEVQDRGKFITANKWIYENMNTTASMNPDCLKAHADDPFQCNFAQNTVQYIDAPMFALQARFDAWQTTCILESANAAKINEYGSNFTTVFMNSYLNGGAYHAKHGAFLDSCHHHCGEWNDMHVDGMDQSQAELQFYSKHAAADKHLWFQNSTYPCASCCKD
eukprot:352430_1